MNRDQERGVAGRFLRAVREKHRYESAPKLADAMRARGIMVSASTIATLESHGIVDTDGKRWHVEAVAAFLDEPMPDLDAPDPARAGEGMAELIEALSEQTKALRALAGAIERQAGDQVTMAEQQSLALGVLARVLAPRGTDIGAALQAATSDLAVLRRLSGGSGQ